MKRAYDLQMFLQSLSQRRKPLFDAIRHLFIACAFAVFLFASGCASNSSLSDKWTGPVSSPAFEVQSWNWQGQPGATLVSSHYEIHTTISNEDIRQKIVATMEGGLSQYSRIAPGVPLSDRRMSCFVFANRAQWIDYTQRTTGKEASVYMQINRGGYTIRDVYAAYWLGGENGTVSVSAHEGWHQFVARHFVSGLPPFLEEGLATTFEDVEWADNLPRWNPSTNRMRSLSVKHVVEGGNVIPLGDLIAMHAGQVITLPSTKIESFYAEAWAFARFLREAEGGKYKPKLEKLLSDLARGQDDQHSNALMPQKGSYNPAAMKPLFEKYFGVPIEQLQTEFRSWLGHLAQDDFRTQWD